MYGDEQHWQRCEGKWKSNRHGGKGEVGTDRNSKEWSFWKGRTRVGLGIVASADDVGGASLAYKSGRDE